MTARHKELLHDLGLAVAFIVLVLGLAYGYTMSRITPRRTQQPRASRVGIIQRNTSRVINNFGSFVPIDTNEQVMIIFENGETTKTQ